MKLSKTNFSILQGISIALSVVFLLAISSINANAQRDADEDFEKYQDYLYKISEYQIEFPDLIFDYNYDMDGDLESVTIEGVEDDDAKDQLRIWLTKLHETADLLLYGKDENNVYYRTEERARYKEGKAQLYQELRANLEYPEDALDAGIEGVVQLKFVVDRWGNVDKVKAYEDIDAADWITKQMVEEAKEAFNEINHDWIPGEIDNIEVAQWVTIPVHFKVELPRDLQIMM